MVAGTSGANRSDRIVAVLNAGSSSLKYELFTPTGASVAVGNIERVGQPDGCSDHDVAVQRAIADLTARFPDWRDRVVAVGHRVVHGGPTLYQPTLVDDSVIADLERHLSLAPLHNRPALHAIRAARRLLSHVPHVVVFDTDFHHNLPPVARTYAIPTDLAERWAIRRYGAHGISCEYLAERLVELDPGRHRAVLCHLGAGASLTAIQEGRSVDTTMGFTPLEGLVMATRSGDLDPAIVLYLQRQAGLTAAELSNILEHESGLKGLSGSSGDFQAVEASAAAGDAAARLALDVFAYRVRKYLGAYWATLSGLDAIVFAGGIGENSSALRAAVLDPLRTLGVELDPTANETGPAERRISRPDSPVSIWIIPTRETLVIARHALTFAA
jgi:acetate kinase